MIGSGGNRLPWDALPPVIHEGVAEVLGSPVVHAESQPGGFSPGSADRVRTAAGRRAFVKAVGESQNADAAAMHRREAVVARALPATVPAPTLLGQLDVDGWVALVFAEVDGRNPGLPWQVADVQLALDALEGLAAATTPCPVPGLPTARDALAPMFAGTARLAADGIEIPDLDRLCSLAERGLAAVDGDTVVHNDLRADNVLVTTSGMVFVDWPHAVRGAAWLDTLLLLMEVERFGGHEVDTVLASTSTTRGVDPDDLTGVLAGFFGFFADNARRPPPPGLPTIREFQAVQAEAVLSWIRRRAGLTS